LRELTNFMFELDDKLQVTDVFPVDSISFYRNWNGARKF
jgi:hypothetical protein